MNSGNVVCWHVRNYERLRENLERGICDLPSQPTADQWFKRLKLYEGARVQFCATEVTGEYRRGLIVATGTIGGKPEECVVVGHPKYPTCVRIKDVRWLPKPQKQCPCYKVNPRRGSHRLGGKGPCS